MREYAFEIGLCAHIESSDDDRLVARQLGGGVRAPSNRVLDVVLLEPGPEFDQRTEITSGAIPDLAIRADVGPGRARYWKRAFEGLDVGPDVARRAIDRAVETGFFERKRRNGRTYVRQTTRYPDWFGRITAIENKPDLGTPGDLTTQLRKDVSLGLVDAVVLATGSYVTRAHLNRLPEAVGVWRFEPGNGIEVVREPTPLPAADPGVELIDERPGRVDIELVGAAEKGHARRRLAERAYARGWRPTTLPACARATDRSPADVPGVPYCEYKSAVVNPARCGSSCPGYEAASPPPFDRATVRDDRTMWVASPSGVDRRQVGMDHFGDADPQSR